MKNIFLLLAASFVMHGLHAQHSSFTISYPIGFTMGDFNDYIEKTSYRGVSMEFNKKAKENLDIGLEVGWNVFYQKEDLKTYDEGTASISGVQFRYTNAVPIIAGVKYYFEGGTRLAPYIGAGLGTLYVERSTDFGLYRITTDDWQFCLRPEAGLQFKAAGTAALFVGAKYYAAFNGSDLDGQSYMTLNIGVVFTKF